MVRGPKKRLGRPPAVDSEETHQRILEVAQVCFAERGFEGATNAEIAEKAGLTSGSIYHHFGSKTDLYVAVCAHVRDLLLEGLEKAIAGKVSFVDRVTSMLDAGIEIDEEQPSLARFVVGALIDAGRHPQLAPAIEQLTVELNQFHTGLVREGTVRGDLNGVTDEESLVGLIQALVFGFSIHASLAPARLHATVLLEGKRLIDGTLIPRGSPRRRVAKK